jgi:hypothetical protein
MATDLPSPPDSFKKRVVREDHLKRLIGFNLEGVARKMVYRNRMRWPDGAYNPRPVRKVNIGDFQLEETARLSDNLAAEMVAGIIDFHPGFDEAE